MAGIFTHLEAPGEHTGGFWMQFFYVQVIVGNGGLVPN
jgi:hypothetical protein